MNKLLIATALFSSQILFSASSVAKPINIIYPDVTPTVLTVNNKRHEEKAFRCVECGSPSGNWETPRGNMCTWCFMKHYDRMPPYRGPY